MQKKHVEEAAMARVLVTGCAGFIGSHLVEALLNRGDEVAGIDCFNDYYDPAIKRRNLSRALGHARFTLWDRDICDEPAVRSVFDAFRPDVVVHLAARAGVRPSIRDPNLYHRVNVIGSQHILDACRDFGGPYLVFASSSSVYGGSDRVPFREDDPVARPVSPYAATKRMNELQAHVYSHLYGLQITMLRFFTVYGPRQRPDMAIHKFARAILEGRALPMFGDGSSRRDYTYIDDIISGVLAAIDHPREYDIFNLGESRTVSLTELIALLEEVLGRRALIDRHPPQPGDVPITYADISRARELLGWEPRTPVEEGLRHFAAWLVNPW
ncbi:MAG TPA: GDP-mannose 4,6-dehydratase [Candidatus Hydrogenedentes bacterium]|nr:GDP-mannose 4,6-dehydratase [Candidatus Hydrogenedentota bacterium]HOK90605.1 GDP-mannose 4,6-dehydratase [Candidatus Hydrogenedentota bacterium]HPO30600.1 GDP-mannose 4,6-dehydratase [Candidatus Hydrogenedentota bacterium]